MTTNLRRSAWFLLRILPLVLVWVALWGSPSIGTIVSGVAVALGVVALFPTGPGRLPHQHRGRLQPVRAVLFLGYFLVELVVSTASVVLAVLAPRGRVREGVVMVRLRSSSPVIATFVANAITLTPGTLTVDAVSLDDRAVELRVHVLGLRDPEAVRESALRLERLAIGAFGSRQDRDLLATAKVTP